MSKKYVRPFTPAWRWAIAIGSVGAFLGGWAVLAHTPNPYETAQASDTPAVEVPSAVPAPNQTPLQNTQRSRRQRQFQPLPLQGQDPAQELAPQIQPNTQIEPGMQTQPMTRTRSRLRTGGS